MKTPLLLILVLGLLLPLTVAADEIVIGGLDGLDPLEEQPSHRVLLALSGGGMRGLAAIGVLKAFEEAKLDVEGLAGTSMGGIVGGLYAAGYTPEELSTIARKLDFAALLQNAPPRTTMLQTRRRERGRDLLTIRFDGIVPEIPQALTSGQSLTNLLTQLTTRATYRSAGDFLNLRVPFATVSTDVVSGEKRVLTTGSLADAMRATMAFPLAFTGLEIDGELLMDGGMVDPLPVDVARTLSDSVDFVVAVNTASPLMEREEIVTPVDIANQVTSIMTAEKLSVSVAEADYVIAPVPDEIQSSDYRFCDSLIELGYVAGRKAADSIKVLLDRTVDTSCYTIREIELNEILGPHRQTIEGHLAKRHCTRHELIADLKRITRELSLFRLGARLDTVGGSTDSAHRLTLTGWKHLAPGALEYRFIGNTRFEDALLVRTLALNDSLITPGQLSSGLDRIRRLYYDREWDLFTIRNVIIEPDRNLVSIVMDEAIVKHIWVENARRSRSWYVRAHFPVETGEPYSTRRAAEGIRNIYGTDLFERVTVDLVPEDGRAVVTIRVEEKAYRQVKLGWHWDDEYESEEFIEIGDDNIGGFGLELFGHARYSPDRQDYHLGFKADRIFKTYLTSRVKVYRTLLDRHLYDETDSLVAKRGENKTGVELRIGQQIARLGTLSGALIIEDVEYEFDYLDPRVEENFGLTRLSLESLVETFDRVPFPQSGNRLHVELHQAVELLGGDMEFTRIAALAEGYFPLGLGLNYHPKLALGGSRPELPVSEKFYLGGMHSFAGYRTHQLAGDKMLLMSHELRLGLPLRLYVSARYDAGNVYGSTDDIKLANIRQASGLFLAFDSPIGPFEVGYGVADDSSEQFYIRAGFDF